MASRVTTFIVVLIVAGTLIAGYMVGAERADEDGPVDLIITNAQVFTGGPGGDLAEAVAIRGDKILKVGSNRDIKRLRRPHTLTLDAHGATVLPGFNDSHAHLLSGGLALAQLDLTDAKSLDAIRDTIRSYAAAHPDRPWIRGRGWYYEPFSGLPTRQLLDQLVPDRPVYLEAYDGHTGWANTKALAAAHITRRTKNPSHGSIVKDPRTGEPTGALVESAMDLVEHMGPQPTREEKLQGIRDAIALAHTFGVTSVQNASGSIDDFALYDTLRRNGELDLRVYQALTGGPNLSSADLDAFDAVRKQFPDDPLLKAGAVKLFVDGVVESQTAAMLAPYATSKIAGTPAFTPEQLTRVVTTLDARGWQVFSHAIGDRAIRMTLDAYQHAAQANPSPDRGRRHRIEHIETLDPADLPRFASIGVIASMQPDHGDPAPDLITVWKTTLGDERASRGWMYGSLLGAGAHVAFGSDWPVVSLDPRFGLHVATTRTSPNREPDGGWIPNEKIPLADALRAYTSGGAWASFDEQRKGTLKPGMLADVVILSGALFGPDAARILETKVTVTIFDGRVVYDSAAKPSTDD
jgi:predicted amidohydrolase YtcJ